MLITQRPSFSGCTIIAFTDEHFKHKVTIAVLRGNDHYRRSIKGGTYA